MKNRIFNTPQYMTGKRNRAEEKQYFIRGNQLPPDAIPSSAWKKVVPNKVVREEVDPAWRQWFIEIAQRRQDYENRRKTIRRMVESEKKEGEKSSRALSEPVMLAKSMKKALPERLLHLSAVYSRITELWNRAVGVEIAAESALYSFKAGIVTITIFSSTLLQEIRQFHTTAILADLRDIWTVSTPLLGIRYRIGEREEI